MSENKAEFDVWVYQANVRITYKAVPTNSKTLDDVTEPVSGASHLDRVWAYGKRQAVRQAIKSNPRVK